MKLTQITKITHITKGVGGGGIRLIPEYKAVLSAMASEPSDADKVIQNNLLKQLVDGGYYAKAELIDIFATHDGGQIVNWANPGTFTPVPIGSPNFEAYGGYKGATGKYVKLSFNPTTNGTKIGRDNICAIVGIGDNVSEATYDFGAGDGTTYFLMKQNNSGFSETFCNSISSTAKANAIPQHFSMSRGNSTTYLGGIGTVLGTNSKTANSLINKELYTCGWNNNGTAAISTKRIRYVLLFSYLTDIEIREVVSIMDEYLRNYSKQLLPYTIAYPVNSTKQQINLDTFVTDNNEVIHPSVLDLGTQWNGYRYWQANTPYPLSNGNYELQCIWASNDAKNWEVPVGLTNPLFAYDGVHHYYSDPDLFFENDTLYMFYRTTDTPGNISMIKVIESTDGITWNTSTPTTVLDLSGDSEALLTPSVIKVGTDYYMYGLSDKPAVNTLARYKCSTLTGTYGNKEMLTVSFLLVSHISVFYTNSTYYLAIGNNANGGIFICKSTDGVTFTRDGDTTPNIYKTKDYETKTSTSLFYRPDIIFLNGKLWVYYSVNSSSVVTEGNYMGRQMLELI